MAVKVGKRPEVGGAFFDAAGHRKAVAILIEPRRFQADRAGGKYGAKDTIHADLTVFDNIASLKAGEPSTVEQGVMVQQTILVKDLQDILAQEAVLIARLDKIPTENGSAFVFRDLEDAEQDLVVQYAEARDEALAKDMDDAPDFGDDA